MTKYREFKGGNFFETKCSSNMFSLKSGLVFLTHWLFIHCVSKNDADVAHYNFDADQPILIILAEMLLREYDIKQ